jgi:hypothetical protein
VVLPFPLEPEKEGGIVLYYFNAKPIKSSSPNAHQWPIQVQQVTSRKIVGYVYVFSLCFGYLAAVTHGVDVA